MPIAAVEVEKKLVPVMVTTAAAELINAPDGQTPPVAIEGIPAVTFSITFTVTPLLAAVLDAKTTLPV